MRRVRLLTVALALLLAPRVSAAGILGVTLREPLGFDFGLSGASFFSSGFDNIFIDGVFQETPWLSGFSGNVEIVPGPFVSLSLTDLGGDHTASTYEFGPGTFTLTADWTDAFGAPAHGSFVAPLLGLTIDVSCERDLAPDQCGDPGGSNGDAFASMGPGLFDPLLASMLHIRRDADPFDFSVGLDEITGNPSSALRYSGSAAGREALAIGVEAPEPSAVSLLLLSAFAALGSSRVRKRCRSRSAQGAS